MRKLLFSLMLIAGAICARPSFAADPRLEKATDEVGFLAFEKAYNIYKQVIAEAPAGSEDWQAASFGAAVCAQQILPTTDERIKEARDLFRQLVDKSPDSKFSPRALLNLGRLEELSGDPGHEDLDAARTNYLEVVKRWPAAPIAGEATLRAAATLVQSYDKAKVESGIKMIVDWLGAHPNDNLAAVMWQYLGDTYFYPLNDYAKSLDAYEHADKLGWVEPSGEGKTYWRIAVMSERYLKNREMAIKYYTIVITRTPTSGKAYEAQLALKRLGAPVPAIQGGK